MTSRPLAVAIMAVGLVLAGCSASSLPAQVRTAQPAVTVPSSATGAVATAITPSATVAASPTGQLPSPTIGLPTSTPPSPLSTTGPTSTPPSPATSGLDDGSASRAWGVAPNGQFYLLQSSGVIQRFSPDLSHVVDQSSPLFGGRDPGRSHMAIGEEFLILSSEALTRTLVLESGSFAPVWQLDHAGPVALDGSRRLFVLSEDAVWAYDLANASASPTPVTAWPVDAFTPRPRNLTVDTNGNQVLVTLHDVSASPPHQQEWYASYDLDSLQPRRAFSGQPGELMRPSIGGGLIVARISALNGFLGSKVAVFDAEGREVRAAQPFDGKPVIDSAGEWIYVLRERGLWVLRASDLSVAAVNPRMSNAGQDLLLSPDGSKLYLVEDGAIAIEDTARLRSERIATLRGPVLPNWFDPAKTEFFRPRFYPAPGTSNTAYLEAGGYGETWLSEDRGKTWRLLPGLVYPNFRYVTHLSISPDFSQDQTIVVATASTPAFIRSTDRGGTWSAWDPPVAFVSDRDGNREIYTASRGKLGGGPAENVVRRTNDPAADENPAWSPGWSRIGFQSNRNGNWDIFTIRADCDPASADAAAQCDLRQITNDPDDDILPAWSPDGRWIAFVSMRAGSAEIYVVATEGGPAQRLTTSGTGAWRPAWMPDSERLLYTATRSDGTNDIVLGRIAVGEDGSVRLTDAHPLVNSAYDERDAAVGRELFVYLSNETGQSHTYGRYTTYDQATSFLFTAGAEAEGHPALLEDGSNTVLVTLERGGQTGIYRANTSGYDPFVVAASFNGQPAAGPVLWRPSADRSQERLKAWQK